MTSAESTRLQRLAQVARTSAREAGALVRDARAQPKATSSKSTAIDLVTATDIAAGVKAVQVIADLDPDASFIVEEPEVLAQTNAKPGELADHVWVIDPIDGTTSFVHDFPCFSVSIALLEQGRPVAGAVYNVPLDEMCWGVFDGGAFRDGVRLRASQQREIEKAVLVTGFPYDRGRPLELQLSALSAFLRLPVQDIRRDGSAAVDCCNVASQRCDGFWEYGLKVWDMAAGVLICEEAGCSVSDVEGRSWSPQSTSICAANPVLHEQMLDVIAQATRGM